MKWAAFNAYRQSSSHTFFRWGRPHQIHGKASHHSLFSMLGHLHEPNHIQSVSVHFFRVSFDLILSTDVSNVVIAHTQLARQLGDISLPLFIVISGL